MYVQSNVGKHTKPLISKSKNKLWKKNLWYQIKLGDFFMKKA